MARRSNGESIVFIPHALDMRLICRSGRTGRGILTSSHNSLFSSAEQEHADIPTGPPSSTVVVIIPKFNWTRRCCTLVNVVIVNVVNYCVRKIHGGWGTYVHWIQILHTTFLTFTLFAHLASCNVWHLLTQSQLSNLILCALKVCWMYSVAYSTSKDSALQVMIVLLKRNSISMFKPLDMVFQCRDIPISRHAL